ncbi:MAG: M4 family metallopeptidase [Saprospiraceae bacterium]|nr:M4 family metallopeptidase [Saprospiraceae bacterium]MBK7736920.1 M4 family metallopeptidase [Saprospiraceae bacterium]MBK7914486.1 M4 family metallopeptidase [Saprospiraceae bacterium]
MYKVIAAIAAFLFCINIYSQVKSVGAIELPRHGANQNWYIPAISESKLNIDQLTSNFNSYLNLSESNSFQVLSSKIAKDQWIHTKFQQYYNGVKVLGASFLVHEYNGQVESLNGRREDIRDLNTIPDIEVSELPLICLQKYPQFFTQDPNPVQHFTNAELLIMDAQYPNRSGEFKLAFKLDYDNHDLFVNRRFYIDAVSGEMILSYDLIQSCVGGKGIAQTLYHGDQEMDLELIDSEFQLTDNSRGNGIQTISESGRTYKDQDNYWEKGSFAQRRGALDIQFGSQKTIDFYKKYFDRDGIDGKNLKLINKLRDSVYLVNAYWNSTGTLFGIGDSINTGPITSIDIVGHELTHGVTQFTCGLEYLYESGAINEGLSDIFGKTIEQEYDPAGFNWLLGSKPFVKKDTAFRNMADPNHYRNPKLYKGKYWINNSSDNGGVHTNSGVINYWFYILSVGESGTNEAGQTYVVEKLGMIPTLNILYDAMDNYLTSTSYYFDVREATLLIAEKNYGKCSKEYLNIAEAWKAVGVGKGLNENDLQLVNNKIPQIACKEGLFPVEIRIVNLSCNNSIPKGTDMVFTISVPQKNKIIENYTTTEDILPGGSFVYAFINPARIDRNISITVEASIANDADTSNNRITMAITKNANSDHDFRSVQIQINGSSCENGFLRARVTSNYTGCSPVPKGTELQLNLKYDNQVITRTFNTTTTIFPGNQYQSPFFNLDRVFSGYKKILGELDYAKDTVDTNNAAYFNAVYINNVGFGYLESFSGNQFDSTLLGLKIDSFQNVKIQSDFINSESIVFTGGKIFNANKFIPTNGSNLADFISSNPKYTSTLYLCVDTKDLSKAKLSFDYIQKLGSFSYDSILNSKSFAAGIRVQFRNETGGLIGMPNYIQSASREALNQYYEQDIPINGEAITIEVTCITLNGVIDSLSSQIDTSSDLVILDNIKIFKEAVKAKDEPIATLFVAPNPFQKSFKVYVDPTYGELHYMLVNTVGVVVDEGSLRPEWNELQANGLSSGSYVLKCINSKGKLFYSKLVKN